MTYGVVSDIHSHSWGLFSKTLETGVNSRLQIVLDELVRAAKETLAQGGKTLIVAGDVFHKREFIDQEVLNPVRDVFRQIADMGLSVLIIPGNHDLKSEETCELSSSVQNLNYKGENGRIVVLNKSSMFRADGHILGFVPWRANKDALLADLAELAKSPHAAKADVFIHAGIDGVLSGVPAGGLTAAKLASFGFNRVFAGHYHHHRNMGDGIYSIGATAHQNWGDIGTAAGFLTVTKDNVVFNDTQAPKFIDLSGMSEEDMQLEVPGNYARFRGPQMTQENINELRQTLKDWGAAGVSIEVPRAVTNVRAPSSSGQSLGQSIGSFVDDDQKVPAHISKDAIKQRAMKVLDDVQTVTEEVT